MGVKTPLVFKLVPDSVYHNHALSKASAWIFLKPERIHKKQRKSMLDKPQVPNRFIMDSVLFYKLHHFSNLEKKKTPASCHINFVSLRKKAQTRLNWPKEEFASTRQGRKGVGRMGMEADGSGTTFEGTPPSVNQEGSKVS